MSNENLIEALDENIRRSREFVEMGKALSRLTDNKDFIRVVKEGYFEKESVRLVHLKADPSMESKERQESIVRQMDAIGAFSAYLRKVLIEADRAEQNIAADEVTREELLAEEG